MSLKVFVLGIIVTFFIGNPLHAHRQEVQQVMSKIADFKVSHPNFQQLTPEEFSKMVFQGQKELMAELGVNKVPTPLNATILAALNTNIQKTISLYIMLRHGEQWMSPDVIHLPNDAMRKIVMMRGEDNLNNPVSTASLVDLYAVSLGFAYLQEPSLKWSIESSHNMRAQEAADILAWALNTSTTLKNCWDCINYPEENIIATADLLTLLPTGTLPWEQTMVDRVIGQGTFDRIHRDVHHSLTKQKGNRATIVVTHTQQLNALAEQLHLPISRLGNYAFISILSRNDGTTESATSGLQ